MTPAINGDGALETLPAKAPLGGDRGALVIGDEQPRADEDDEKRAHSLPHARDVTADQHSPTDQPVGSSTRTTGLEIHTEPQLDLPRGGAVDERRRLPERRRAQIADRRVEIDEIGDIERLGEELDFRPR